MKFLVDTDWVVAALKGRTDARNLLSTLLADGLAISLITYGEVYEGIYFGTDPTRHEQSFLAFLMGVDVLPLNEEIMKEFASLRGTLRSSGNMVSDFDLLIASTAIHYNLILVTRNTSISNECPGFCFPNRVRKRGIHPRHSQTSAAYFSGTWPRT